MGIEEEAARLVKYLEQLDDLTFADQLDPLHHHMGATICDAVVQGRPTFDPLALALLQRVMHLYPEAKSVSGFYRLLRAEGASLVLLWPDGEKVKQVVELTRFLRNERIETEEDFADWLASEENRSRLSAIRGIGPETCDYIRTLLGTETLAGDLLVWSHLHAAGVLSADGSQAGEVLNRAADVMGVPRRLFNYSLWKYVASPRRNRAARNRRNPGGQAHA